MGGKTSSEIKKQITNEISLEISNTTKNLNTITNISSTELTQEIENKVEAEIKVNTGGINIIDVDEITFGRNSTVNINQDIKIAAVTNAIIKILSDTSQKQNSINNMAEKIKNKIDNDSTLKQDVDFLAKIGKSSSDAGGPEAFVNALADTVQTLISTIGNIGGSSSSSDETEIRNTIKNQINNVTINQTDITNKISTSIKNKMEQLGSAICDVETVGNNSIISQKLTALDGSIANINQTIDISSFSSCIIELQLGSTIASDLTNDFKVDTGSDTTNTSSGDQKAKVVADITEETRKDSSIMKGIDNLVNNVSDIAGSWIYIIGGIVGLIILIIVAVILVPMMRSSSVSSRDDGDNGDAVDGDAVDGDNDDNQRGGGNINSDIYLFASFIAIFILIANKSLPLCGVLLIVIILYLVNKKKPELLSLQN
jgi:uncharacterized membrane protein